jgi:hydroxyacylglutathione hydrolase
MAEVQIVDVRREGEFADGHIDGAMLMPLHKLESMVSKLGHDRPIAVHCKGGYRSAIGCSLIQRAGFENVMNVMGGFDAWIACGLPAVKPAGPTPSRSASSGVPVEAVPGVAEA